VDESAGDVSWVAIARILRPRGRRGEVVADVLTDFPERFATLRRAWVQRQDEKPRPVEIAKAWWHQQRLILHFAEISSISDAEQLRGWALVIPLRERLSLGENRYYVSDLIGCEVIERGGRSLGHVSGVEPTGGVDLLRIDLSSPGGRQTDELTVPFAREICPEIDVQARRIVIDPPEGLLELNRDRPTKQ